MSDCKECNYLNGWARYARVEAAWQSMIDKMHEQHVADRITDQLTRVPT